MKKLLVIVLLLTGLLGKAQVGGQQDYLILNSDLKLLTLNSASDADSVLTVDAFGHVRKINRNRLGGSSLFSWREQFDDDNRLQYPITGINKTFVLSHVPFDTATVYKNGLRQIPYIEYIISNDTIIMTNYPYKKDIIQVFYKYTSAQPAPTRYSKVSSCNIVFNGNSLIYGAAEFPGKTDVVTQAKAMFSTVGDTLINAGYSGYTTTQLNAQRASLLYPYLNSAYGKNIVVFYEYINDILQNNLTSRQAYLNAKNYFNTVRSEQPFVIWASCNVAPCGLIPDSVISNLNSQLAADHSWMDTLIDVTTRSAFSSSGAWADPHYYQKDKIHLYTDGYFELAKAIYPYVRSLTRKVASDISMIRPASQGSAYSRNGNTFTQFDTTWTDIALGTNRKANIHFKTWFNDAGGPDSLAQWKIGLRGDIASQYQSRFDAVDINAFPTNAYNGQKLNGLLIRPAFGWLGSFNPDDVSIMQVRDRFGDNVLNVPYFKNATTNRYDWAFTNVNAKVANLSLDSLVSGTAGTDSLLTVSNGVVKKISPSYYSTSGGGGTTGTGLQVLNNTPNIITPSFGTSVTGLATTMLNPDNAGNIAQTLFTTTGGTNTLASVGVTGRGTGVGGIMSQLVFHGLDVTGGVTNQEALLIRAINQSIFTLNSIASGTGTIRPVDFQFNGTSCLYLKTNGSVGINNTSPSASSQLDIASTTKGVLFPRMTTTQKNAISSPAEGLIVYDLTLHKLSLYTGSVWETVTSL